MVADTAISFALAQTARCSLNSFDFAAIHPNRSACEPSSLPRNEVCHQAGDFFRFAIAGDASLFRKMLRGFVHAQSVLRSPFIEETSTAARHNRARYYAVT